MAYDHAMEKGKYLIADVNNVQLSKKEIHK